MPDAPITSVEHLPQAVVVHVLARNLGKTEVNAICATVDQGQPVPAVEKGGPPFIIDMAKVDFAGSLAMGVLVGLNQEFRNRSQRLIFVSLQPDVQRAINTTRIHLILEILPDLPAAVRNIESTKAEGTSAVSG
jgi:anti-anti-sigma factor